MLLDIFRSAKRYWHIEILGGLDKPFRWRRLYQKCQRINRYRYLFWFRLAYAMHQQDSKFWRRRGKLLNERISRQFNVEIMLCHRRGRPMDCPSEWNRHHIARHHWKKFQDLAELHAGYQGAKRYRSIAHWRRRPDTCSCLHHR